MSRLDLTTVIQPEAAIGTATIDNDAPRTVYKSTWNGFRNIYHRVELTNKRMKLVQLVIICCKTYSVEFITGTTMKNITSLTYTTEYHITKRVKNDATGKWYNY